MRSTNQNAREKNKTILESYRYDNIRTITLRFIIRKQKSTNKLLDKHNQRWRKNQRGGEMCRRSTRDLRVGRWRTSSQRELRLKKRRKRRGCTTAMDWVESDA
jgi:hypothetical protein